MRRTVVAVAVLAGVLALLIALAWVGQRRLVFFPSGVVPPPPAGVDEVTLQTRDGLELASWWVTAPDPGAAGATSGASIVVFHGNGGNRAGRLPLARALAGRGHDVLLVGYRGYGGNPGSPSSDGLAIDADAARDWIDDNGRPGAPVAYFGESLGAGVAVELATRRPPDALVLRSPFTSLADIARVHYPVVPAFLLRDSWPTLERIPQFTVPLLVVAGSADEIVPMAQSEAVAAAAGGPSELVVVDGARHNDRALLDGRQLLDAVDAFLATHLG